MTPARQVRATRDLLLVAAELLEDLRESLGPHAPRDDAASACVAVNDALHFTASLWRGLRELAKAATRVTRSDAPKKARSVESKGRRRRRSRRK